MASIEGLSAAVASLTSEVAAMHVENQQESNMLDNTELKVAALASAQDLQAAIDAQAALNNTHEQEVASARRQLLQPEPKVDQYGRQA